MSWAEDRLGEEDVGGTLQGFTVLFPKVKRDHLPVLKVDPGARPSLEGTFPNASHQWLSHYCKEMGGIPKSFFHCFFFYLFAYFWVWGSELSQLRLYAVLRLNLGQQHTR